jgi:hypothetical protein
MAADEAAAFMHFLEQHHAGLPGLPLAMTHDRKDLRC